MDNLPYGKKPYVGGQNGSVNAFVIRRKVSGTTYYGRAFYDVPHGVLVIDNEIKEVSTFTVLIDNGHQTFHWFPVEDIAVKEAEGYHAVNNDESNNYVCQVEEEDNITRVGNYNSDTGFCGYKHSSDIKSITSGFKVLMYKPR